MKTEANQYKVLEYTGNIGDQKKIKIHNKKMY